MGKIQYRIGIQCEERGSAGEFMRQTIWKKYTKCFRCQKCNILLSMQQYYILHGYLSLRNARKFIIQWNLLVIYGNLTDQSLLCDEMTLLHLSNLEDKKNSSISFPMFYTLKAGEKILKDWWQWYVFIDWVNMSSFTKEKGLRISSLSKSYATE